MTHSTAPDLNALAITGSETWEPNRTSHPVIALPVNDDTRAIASRVVWFETPDVALSDAVRFLAYAFRYATHSDMRTLRTFIDDDALRDALNYAPPGIIDGRSWAYWRLMLDLPPRPLPARSFT